MWDMEDGKARVTLIHKELHVCRKQNATASWRERLGYFLGRRTVRCSLSSSQQRWLVVRVGFGAMGRVYLAAARAWAARYASWPTQASKQGGREGWQAKRRSVGSQSPHIPPVLLETLRCPARVLSRDFISLSLGAQSLHGCFLGRRLAPHRS
jgi:hypothetical protein